MGINPTTHKPLNDTVKDIANLSHTAQWETVRLQTEARQVKEYSKLRLQKRLGSSSSSQPSLTLPVLDKVTHRPSPLPCLDILKVWQNSWSSTSSDYNTTPKMHSMYTVMLATDDLVSPVSTLSFPDNVPHNSKWTNSNTMTSGLINQSSLPSSYTAVENDSGMVKGASRGEPWGNKGQSVGESDDIMAAVEAFRSTGYSCYPLEDHLNNNDMLDFTFSC